MMSMVNDLERIGDVAVNIAQRAEGLAKVPKDILPINDLHQMASKVRSMLRESLYALLDLDIESAKRVFQADDEVDLMKAALSYVYIPTQVFFKQVLLSSLTSLTLSLGSKMS